MQLKRLLNRWMPNPAQLRHHPRLRLFGRWLDRPTLWHLNRRTAARAFAVGLFCAWLPIPFQMVVAVAGALLLGANLPLSVALVWLNNPVTLMPMFYGAYKLGARLLGTAPQPFTFEASWQWLSHSFATLGPALLLGTLLLGSLCALLGAIVIERLWTCSVLRRRALDRHSRSGCS